MNTNEIAIRSRMLAETGERFQQNHRRFGFLGAFGAYLGRTNTFQRMENAVVRIVEHNDDYLPGVFGIRNRVQNTIRNYRNQQINIFNADHEEALAMNEQFDRDAANAVYEEAHTENEQFDLRKKQERIDEINAIAGEVPRIVTSLSEPYIEANRNYANPEVDTQTKYFENARTESILIERPEDTNILGIEIKKTRKTNKQDYGSTSKIQLGRIDKLETNEADGTLTVNYKVNVGFGYESNNGTSYNLPNLIVVGNSIDGFNVEGLDTEDPFHMIMAKEIASVGNMLDEMYLIRSNTRRMTIEFPNNPNEELTYSYENKDGFEFNSSELA